MSDILVAGKHGFQVVTKDAWVFEEDKEIAWAGAKDRIVIRPDMGWIVSRYVDLSPPEDLRPNDNGHVFTLEDGERNYPLIRDTPLNWLHHDRFIVGSNVDVELLYHVAPDDAAATDIVEPPGAHIETLATFYRSIYPGHWTKVKDAHSNGLLHSSMEARPDSVTCVLAGCCGETFPFKGVWSKTYCESMQKPGREFILNNPLFLGSAVVVPPHRPGWRNANAVEVATWVEQHLEEAGQLYEQITATHNGDLDDDQIEAIMAALLESAGVGDGNGGRSRISLTMSDDGALRFNLPDGLGIPTVRSADRQLPVRRTNALEDQANHQGVIVAVVPPPAIAEALAALGGEPADQIHVTLAFIGDSGGNDTLEGPDGPITQERLNAVIAVFAASEQPIPATVSGLGRFNAPGDSEVTYASVDAPGLNELRARLVGYLRAAGVPVSADHGFTPHATLQYHAPGEGPTELPDDLSWSIDAIELWWGDDLHAPHGLGGVDNIDQVAAALVVNAIEGLDDLDVAAEVVLLEFVSSARDSTVQAVLDSIRTVLAAPPAGLLAGALIDRKFSPEERQQLAARGEAMPDGCLSGDTMVVTPTGSRPIRDLAGTRGVVLTDVGWSEGEIQSFGPGRLFAVSMIRGSDQVTIEATLNHRWLLSDGSWVITDDLSVGQEVPHVEVGQHRWDTHRFNTAYHRVAGDAQQATHLAGDVVMVDVQARPLLTVSPGAPLPRNDATDPTQATLGLRHRYEVVMGDPVLPEQHPATPAEPPLVVPGDLGGGLLGLLSRAELAVGAAGRASLVEVGVGALNPADATGHEAQVVDRNPRRSLLDLAASVPPPSAAVVGVTETPGDGTSVAVGVLTDGFRHARSYPSPNWTVLAVEDTGRTEETYCAVVPDLHRFVIADGVLTGNSFPTPTRTDWMNARAAIGRANPEDRAKIIVYLKRRAKALGVDESEIPEGW